MSSLPRRGGRGESLLRLLKERLDDKPPESDAASQSPTSPAEASAEQRPISGRGSIMQRLRSTSSMAEIQDEGRRVVGYSTGLSRETLMSVPSCSFQTSDIRDSVSHQGGRNGHSSKKLGAQSLQSDSGHLKESTSHESIGPSVKRMEKLIIAETIGESSSKPPIIMKGNSGTPLQVACNYIRLLTETGKGIFQYDVKFKPDIDSRGLRFNVMKQLAGVIGDTKSFDGTILYLPTKLPSEVTYAKAVMPSDQMEIKVKITFVKSIQMGHSHAIHLYNVLFRRIMNILGLQLHGRHFYDPKGAKAIPEHMLEVWPGYVIALQEYEDGVMLCCDASHRVLRTQTVHELMMDLISLGHGDSWKQQFINLLVGQVVLTRYNNKTYTIDDVDFDSSPKRTFKTRRGEEICYIDYYVQQYNLNIADHGQPLLKSKVKAKVKGQEMSTMVDLIPELCYLSGITDSMRGDHRLMKSIAECTRVSPGQRQVALNRFLQHMNKNEEARQLLDNWGLRLSSSNLVLQSRLLNVEPIYFGRHNSPGSLTCEWTRDATGNPVLSAIALEQWTIICTKRDEKIAVDFVKMCRQVGPRMGIQVENPLINTLSSDSTQNYLQQIQKLKNHNAQLVVLILPMPRADKYAAIKKMCCIEMPIPSQVIITRTIRAPDKLRSVSQKIVLQMNCKLGGTLWTVKIPFENTMVVGLDSYHDSSHVGHSFGAVVASLNPPLTRWYSKIYRQGQGIELIDGLEITLLNCLTKYKEVNEDFPDQIIIYRDGVGDGQLETCCDHEVPQLVAACKRLKPNYDPRFLVVIVQKRISTRMYAESGSNFSNPPPGTILDHTVTRRDLFDFFLVSQNVRQGTVSPTHYIVVHNTTRLDADKIQRLSYKLTHLYYNWCGTVRVPAPCQYAHKLASLVGDSIHKEADEMLADKLYYL